MITGGSITMLRVTPRGSRHKTTTGRATETAARSANHQSKTTALASASHREVEICCSAGRTAVEERQDTHIRGSSALLLVGLSSRSKTVDCEQQKRECMAGSCWRPDPMTDETEAAPNRFHPTSSDEGSGRLLPRSKWNRRPSYATNKPYH